MALFVRLRILKNSVDKKCKFVTLSQNLKEKNHQTLQLFLRVFYRLVVVDLVTFQHDLV